jgi:hypothetical protein
MKVDIIGRFLAIEAFNDIHLHLLIRICEWWKDSGAWRKSKLKNTKIFVAYFS